MGQGEKAEAAGEEAEQVGRGQIKKDLFLDFSMKAWRAMGEGVLDLRVLFVRLFSVFKYCKCSREQIGGRQLWKQEEQFESYCSYPGEK